MVSVSLWSFLRYCVIMKFYWISGVMSVWEREAGTEVCVKTNTRQINKPQTFRETLSFDYVVQEQSLFQAL